MYVIAGAEAGTWRIRRGRDSFASEFSVVWGASDRVPVPADYDTDGWIDIAVYDIDGADAGTWAILRGGDDYRTSFAIPFGALGPAALSGGLRQGWLDRSRRLRHERPGRGHVVDPQRQDRLREHHVVSVRHRSSRAGARRLRSRRLSRSRGLLHRIRRRTLADRAESRQLCHHIHGPCCGEADAVPVPNDYDHDGFNDLACTCFAVRAPARGRCARREASSAR